jgi:hypothetical protein
MIYIFFLKLNDAVELEKIWSFVLDNGIHQCSKYKYNSNQ